MQPRLSVGSGCRPSLYDPQALAGARERDGPRRGMNATTARGFVRTFNI